VPRVALGSLLPAVAIAAAWLALERPRRAGDAALVLCLALTPSLLRRAWLRALASGAAALALFWLAFGARPWEALLLRGSWLARVRDAIERGLADTSAVAAPFDPLERWEMHGLVLLAIFGGTLAVMLLVAERRPVWAAAVLVLAAGGPATLAESRAGPGLGALLLAGCLWLLVCSRPHTSRSLAGGLAAAGAAVALAVGAALSGAVPRGAAIDWSSWDLHQPPRAAVGVEVVWDASYAGIRFPRERTTVLRVRGPERALYWRAAVLDAFQGDRWREVPEGVAVVEARGLLPGDPLLPGAARERRAWVRQQVEVAGLRSDRVPAASTPVALASAALAEVYLLRGGVLASPRGLERGQRYTVWSYAPRPGAAELAASPPAYPAAAGRYLELGGVRLPGFAAPERAAAVEEALGRPGAGLAAYRPLWEQARRLTARERSPYGATVALERWLRAAGSFRYAEQPPQPTSLPPLVDFVVRTRQGYCQHYAGAMALMLRLLGVPARVAVGFTSGRFENGGWTVTDHDAHAWVEAWFAGHGWLAFDPTPGRGTLSAPYSVASDSAAVARALAAGRLPDAVGDGARRGEPEDAAGVATARGRAFPWRALALAGVAALASAGLAKVVRRRIRYLTRDPRRLAAATRAELAGFLRDQGLDVRSGATLSELARRAGALGVDAAPYVAAAGRARHGPPEGAAAAAAAARRELRVLIRLLRGRLGARRRLRGFVALPPGRGT
jgi:transglutaminase-like putative cysteine protease